MTFVGKNYFKQQFTVIPPILKLEKYHASAQVLTITTYIFMPLRFPAILPRFIYLIDIDDSTYINNFFEALQISN